MDRWHRHDRVAVGMLAGLPILMFVVPALAGHPVLPGDDLTQNFPLRVLAGSQLRQGHLPLFDPYIWSGAPLLGGWNAGAAYPLTFLFAVLPGVAAWTLNMTITWWTAGLGTFAFLRASGLAPAAGFLGAFTFAFAGAMTAQIPHYGLVAGMGWVPVALLALLRLSGRPGLRARVAWVSALAGAAALVILAGEPRAIDDALVIVGCYAAWRAWRLRPLPQSIAYLALALAGVGLGVALGAVQWLPGIEAVASSQRVAHSAPLFASGSLPRKWLLLSLVPDLLGGSGSFGQPAFFANYNLTEVTGYAGIMPLAAACALLPRLRWRHPPEWAIWHLVALLGILLALGGNTPLGHVLVHLPFFGGQRLQSRNIVITCFALAVLLGYWVHEWAGEQRAEPWRGRLASRLAGALPGIAAAAVAAAMFAWGPGMLHWLGLRMAKTGHAGPLRPWLVPSALLGTAAAAIVWWGPRLTPRRRVRILACFTGADIAVFTVLTVLCVAPGGGRAAPQHPAVMSKVLRPVAGVGTLTHGGRFAVYDPGLLDSGQLPALGVPDGNILSAVPSVEGYSSLVDAAYAKATGSHLATGEGQDVLSPRAIGNGTLDQLGTTVLVTPAAYLVTPAGSGPAPAPPPHGLRRVAPHHVATWYFGTVLPVTSVTIPAGGPPGGGGARAGLVLSSGLTDWAGPAPGRGGRLRIVLAHPQRGVAVRVAAGRRQAVLGPPEMFTAGGGRYRADGQLQDALVPPRWHLSGFDGAFAVFTDAMARPPLTLRALPHGSAAGAVIRAAGGPRFAPASAEVSSAHGVTVIRAVAGIAGWTATWRPAGTGRVEVLAVRRSGLVQAVTVPGGRGTVTWSYNPPGALSGAWIAAAALAVLIGGNAAAVLARRRGGRGEPGRPGTIV